MTRILSTLIPTLLLATHANAQATASPPAFEVADIKPADPSNLRPGKGRILPGGRIEVPGMTLKNLIMFAYGVQEDMIAGAPKWADTDRFDLVAKAAPETPVATMRLMLQTLLADRFKLVFHNEDKVKSAYVLTVGKRPMRLQEGSGGPQDCSWSAAESGLRRRTCHNLTMAEFARQLPGWGGIGIDLPVIDQTGLKGAYDFQLDVGEAAFGAGEGGRGGDGKMPAAPAPAADSGPTIFNALEQVGLKLENRKIPVAVIVVDRAERPAGN